MILNKAWYGLRYFCVVSPASSRNKTYSGFFVYKVLRVAVLEKEKLKEGVLRRVIHLISVVFLVVIHLRRWRSCIWHSYVFKQSFSCKRETSERRLVSSDGIYVKITFRKFEWWQLRQSIVIKTWVFVDDPIPFPLGRLQKYLYSLSRYQYATCELEGKAKSR